MALRQERRNWTEAEDAVLKGEVESRDNVGSLVDWAAISEKLPGRTNKDCRKRWLKFDSSCRKGTWKRDEDNRLVNAVDKVGTRWTQVARHVGTRTADQCAKRWQHSLDPSVDRSEWNQNEDDLLFDAVSELGRNWRHIATTILPGRSSTHLKNRYEFICRRRQEHGQNICADMDLQNDVTEYSDTFSVNGTRQASDFDSDTSIHSHEKEFNIQPSPLEINGYPGFEGDQFGPTTFDGSFAAARSSLPESLDTEISAENSFNSTFDNLFANPYAPLDPLWRGIGNDNMSLDTYCYDSAKADDIGSSHLSQPSRSSISSGSSQTTSEMTPTNCTLTMGDIDADTVKSVYDMLMRKSVRFNMQINKN